MGKKAGGVGMRNLKLQNQSSMLKWLWKFGNGDNILWKEVISDKYGMEDNWTTNIVTIYHTVVQFGGLSRTCGQ